MCEFADNVRISDMTSITSACGVYAIIQLSVVLIFNVNGFSGCELVARCE